MWNSCFILSLNISASGDGRFKGGCSSDNKFVRYQLQHLGSMLIVFLSCWHSKFKGLGSRSRMNCSQLTFWLNKPLDWNSQSLPASFRIRRHKKTHYSYILECKWSVDMRSSHYEVDHGKSKWEHFRNRKLVSFQDLRISLLSWFQKLNLRNEFRKKLYGRLAVSKWRAYISLLV